jgi:hypothetical protein
MVRMCLAKFRSCAQDRKVAAHIESKASVEQWRLIKRVLDHIDLSTTSCSQSLSPSPTPRSCQMMSCPSTPTPSCSGTTVPATPTSPTWMLSPSFHEDTLEWLPLPDVDSFFAKSCQSVAQRTEALLQSIVVRGALETKPLNHARHAITTSARAAAKNKLSKPSKDTEAQAERKRVHSKGYHTALQEALKQGKSKEEAMAFARVAARRASAAWAAGLRAVPTARVEACSTRKGSERWGAHLVAARDPAALRAGRSSADSGSSGEM